METDRISTSELARRSPALAQGVAAPLTRAAIFLVATLNPGSENRASRARFVGTSPRWCERLNFVIWREDFPASSGLDPRRGIACSGSLGRRNCIPSARFARAYVMRSRPRAHLNRRAEVSTPIA